MQEGVNLTMFILKKSSIVTNVSGCFCKVLKVEFQLGMMIFNVVFPFFMTCGCIYVANSLSICNEKSDRANEAIDDIWLSYTPFCEEALDYKLNTTEMELLVIISFQ